MVRPSSGPTCSWPSPRPPHHLLPAAPFINNAPTRQRPPKPLLQDNFLRHLRQPLTLTYQEHPSSSRPELAPAASFIDIDVARSIKVSQGRSLPPDTSLNRVARLEKLSRSRGLGLRFSLNFVKILKICLNSMKIADLCSYSSFQHMRKILLGRE